MENHLAGPWTIHVCPECGDFDCGHMGHPSNVEITVVPVVTPGEPCDAKIWHGPGHQSSTRCHLEGPHEIHEAIYGSHRQQARWKDGSYTDGLREKGIEFDPESYPENMAMSGFFDEPPPDPDDD